MKPNLFNSLRIILGIFLVAYALNKFFQIIPTSYGQMQPDAEDFLDSIILFLPWLYMFEIILGFLLILNKWTALLLIVLFPLSCAFMLFSIVNSDIGEIWPAVIVAGINITLILNKIDYYKPLLE